MRSKVAATALAAGLLFHWSNASGLPQRTFVSASSGADSNFTLNCSIVNPCRSFGTALTVTSPDGEIVVLDSGGYGRVTIDKSVAIIAPTGIYAGISVFSGFNGVDILTDNLTVVLRGLTINGQGGQFGVVMSATNVHLRIESCVIANFNAASSYGVDVLNTGGDVSIKDTIVRDNTNGMRIGLGHGTFTRLHVEGNAFYGIRLADVHASINESTSTRNGIIGLDVNSFTVADAVITVSDTSISDNGEDGVVVTSNGSKSALVAITRSTIGANGQSGVNVRPGGTGAVRVEITASTVKANSGWGLAIVRLSGAGASVLTAAGNLISGNSGQGILASGNDTYAIASHNTITMNNGVGLEQAATAVLESSVDNVVRGNNFGAAQTTGTITPFSGI